MCGRVELDWYIPCYVFPEHTFLLPQSPERRVTRVLLCWPVDDCKQGNSPPLFLRSCQQAHVIANLPKPPSCVCCSCWCPLHVHGAPAGTPCHHFLAYMLFGGGKWHCFQMLSSTPLFWDILHLSVAYMKSHHILPVLKLPDASEQHHSLLPNKCACVKMVACLWAPL